MMRWNTAGMMARIPLWAAWLLLAALLTACGASGSGPEDPDGDTDTEDGDEDIPDGDEDETDASLGVLDLSHTQVDFGAVRLGEAVERELLVSNTGTEPVRISVIRPDRATSTEFAVGDLERETEAVTLPLNLPPGGSLTVRLSYTPRDAGPDEGILQIGSNASNGSILEVPLLSQEKGDAFLDLPASLDLGTVRQIGEELQGVLIIANTPRDAQSNKTLQVTGIAVTQGGRNFYVDPQTCLASANRPILIAPGKTHACTVSYLPRDAGGALGTLRVTVDETTGEDAAQGEVSLLGRCAPPGTVMTVTLSPSGDPVAGVRLYRRGFEDDYEETDHLGRALVIPPDGGAIYVADGEEANEGLHTRQYRRIQKTDETAVFIVQRLHPERAQPVQNGETSNPELPGAVLLFDPETVTAPEGAGLFFEEGSPLASPYDPPEGQVLRYLLWFGPHGTTFTEPARLFLPNFWELSAGEERDLYGFDETALSWDIAAVLRVAEDGTHMDTVSGGLPHFSAYGFFDAPHDYTVTGRISNILNAPQGNIIAHAIGGNGPMRAGTTDAQGLYTMHQVTAPPPPTGRVMVWASYSGSLYDSSANWVFSATILDPETPIQMPELKLPVAFDVGQVRGHAWRADGSDVAGAVVQVKPYSGPLLSTLTNEQGLFSLSEVPAGAATVTIRHDGLGLSATLEGNVPSKGQWNLGDVTLSPTGDTGPPRLLYALPADGRVEILPPATVRLVFDEPLAVASASVSLARLRTGAALPGTTTLEDGGRRLVFTPAAALAEGIRYRLTVPAGLSDAGGNATDADITVSFRTVTPVCPKGICRVGGYAWEDESCFLDLEPENTPCKDDGLTCTLDRCDAQGACLHNTLTPGSCLIAGVCHESGESPDADGCVACDPETSQTAWTNMDGSVCAVTDDGNPCTDNVCSGGLCIVQVNNTNPCDLGYPCTTDRCLGGECVLDLVTEGCFIDTTCYAQGVKAGETGDDSCEICAPGSSRTAWTVLTSGPCDDEDLCTLQDTCGAGGHCAGTPNTCSGRGTCDPDDGNCECENPHMTPDCGACVAESIGVYPTCFVPGPGYCAHNACFRVPPTTQPDCYSWAEPWETVACVGGIPAVCGQSPPTAGCGQDAQYPNHSRSFVCYDAGGEQASCASLPNAQPHQVVTDSLTGLMWQRTWTGNRSWDDALDSCDITLNGGGGYAGFTDWRTPSPHELLSLTHNSRDENSPAIDTSAFPGTPMEFFWALPSVEINPDYAWGVTFANGLMGTNLKSFDSFNVRCVRGGATEASDTLSSPFIVSGPVGGEQTVQDVVSGLVWARTHVTGKTWLDALAYCEGLSYAGQTDWRLPDKNELASLISYDSTSPASDFPSMSSQYFWTSSSSSYFPDSAWIVYFYSGGVFTNKKSTTYYARCVRGGP